MTDWNKQGPRYKKLAQEQAEEIRRLRYDLDSARQQHIRYLQKRAEMDVTNQIEPLSLPRSIKGLQKIS